MLKQVIKKRKKKKIKSKYRKTQNRMLVNFIFSIPKYHCEVEIREVKI